MADWYLIRKGGDYTAIGEKHHIHPVLARILKNRGVESDEEIEAFLHGGMECLHPAEEMKDMERCAGILLPAIREGRKIRVIGDYDIDGVCATAILLKGLWGLGANADHCIPHRIRDGYGMNPDMIRQAAADGVEYILTCDNGISAADEAALAKELGITLLITDHHEPPYRMRGEEREYLLPDAAVIVDPKQSDCPYPFKGICGAFVAAKLIGTLYRTGGTELAPSFYEELIQLAAFATVGDIMELKDENRVLVKEGLRLLSQRPAPGFRELIEVLGLSGKQISSYHLGFVLGPCINASGRIDTADRALELFTTDDPARARTIAGELRELNESRKSLTEQATKAAAEQIDGGEHAGMKVYVIFLPDCHESIAGIVAGRITERYEHPTLVVTKGEEGLKGSARSVPAYHMYDALTEVAELFTRFGGHAQAAGFSLPEENLPELRRRLNENCRVKEEEMKRRVEIDLELPLKYASPELVTELALLEPCGCGNEKPVLARQGLTLKHIRPVGQEAKLTLLAVEDEGREYELKLFFAFEELKEYLKEKHGSSAVEALLSPQGGAVRFAGIYTPQWNEYRGERKLQLVLEDYK